MCKEGCKGVCTSVSFKNKCNSWQELVDENKLAIKNLKELILIDDANDELANILISERRTLLLAELQKDMEELKHRLSDEDDPYEFGIIPQQIALKEKLEAVSKELKSLLKPVSANSGRP
jgi:hypothetical protein